MTLPLKPRVITPVTRIINKTQSVTANVDFEDIDLTINGEGSEVYDYEYMFVVHNTTTGSNPSFSMLINSEIAGVSYDRMQGETTSAQAVSTTAVSIDLGLNKQTQLISKGRITGYVGNKRHIDCFSGREDSVRIKSFFTNDTATEITSVSFRCSNTTDLTYSLFIYAKPKLQYNHEAIRLPRETWTAQSDTRTVSGFSGEDYDVVVESELGETSANISIRSNGNTSSRIVQYLSNYNGSLSSATSTLISDGKLSQAGNSFLNKEIGRKGTGFSIELHSDYFINQEIATTWNSDTTTEFTTLDLAPNTTITGHADVYLVPKCYNDTIIPFEFRQVININGNFSAGQTVEIPSWASFIRVRTLLNSASGFTSIRGDFNGVGQTCNTQYLRALSSAASAGTGSDSYVTLARVDLLAKSEFIMNLESGYNRPALMQASQDEDEMRFYYESVQDTVSTFTNVKIYASNTNTLQGEIVVDFI